MKVAKRLKCIFKRSRDGIVNYNQENKIKWYFIHPFVYIPSEALFQIRSFWVSPG